MLSRSIFKLVDKFFEYNRGISLFILFLSILLSVMTGLMFFFIASLI